MHHVMIEESAGDEGAVFLRRRSRRHRRRRADERAGVPHLGLARRPGGEAGPHRLRPRPGCRPRLSRTCGAPPSTSATGSHAIGLTTFPMLSGGKGFHIVAPLTRRAEWPEVKAFCRGFAVSSGAMRRIATSPTWRRRSARAASSSTIFATSAARPRSRPIRRARATARRSPRRSPGRRRRRSPAANIFTVENMPERARKVGDPWPGYFDVRQSITKALMKAVNAA